MSSLQQILLDAVPEDRRLYACAAAEIIAGCICAFTRQQKKDPNSDESSVTVGSAKAAKIEEDSLLWEAITPVMEVCLAESSLDTMVSSVSKHIVS